LNGTKFEILIHRREIQQDQLVGTSYEGLKSHNWDMNPTIFAAAFTSSLALLGLTVGKDSKVSEFRQQWIDELRADVSEFLASVQHLFGFRVVEKYKKISVDPVEHSKALLRTNELSTRIRLRLDPEKPLSIKLTAEMQRLRSIAHEADLLETELLLQAHVVEKCAASLLDEAWEKVKSGEGKYRWCIWISSCILALCVLAIVVTSVVPLHDWLVSLLRRV
jgi:hypothetical protein